MKYLKKFESYVNGFNFEIGKFYEFNDLPNQVKNDILVQFEDTDIDQYHWEFKTLEREEISEYIDTIWGVNIDDEIETPYMKGLIQNIQKNGLDFPAVGIEGNHRALAHWYLGIPLPYLNPVLKTIN